MTRRLIALVIVSVLGIAIVALAIASTPLLRGVAERELRAAGFAQGQVALAGIGYDGLHFTDIRPDTAGAVRIEELVVPWSLGLLRGAVDRATLVGARLVIDTRGVGSGAGAIGWGAPPQVTLTLRRAVIEVLTATGSAVLTLDATATPRANGTLRIAGEGMFRHSGDPAFVVPLAASVVLDATAAGLTVQGRLADAASGLDLALVGGVQPMAGTGELRFTSAPVWLSTEHPLAGISPALERALAALAHDISGRLTLEARLAWTARATTTTARVRLDDVGFASDAGNVTGLSGMLAFADLDPLRLDGAQRLRVRRAESGVALEDLDVELRQNAAGALIVQHASAAALGGRIEAGPITVSTARQRSTVRFTDVAVAQVLTIGGPQGLTGSGALSGQVAVQIAPDQVTLERGELASTGPGQLAYVPANPVGLGEQAATMLAVLSDFRYERLTVTFERNGEGLVGRMRIEGHNPAFQEGRAVVLNVNLSGDVEQALQAALGLYRLPAEILRRVETLEPGQRPGR
jgi:hypothetical protein